MTATTQQALLGTLLQHVRDTRAAYYQGINGVTYEDMQAAANRYLRMQEAYAAAKEGRKPKNITKARIAYLLRGL